MIKFWLWVKKLLKRPYKNIALLPLIKRDYSFNFAPTRKEDNIYNISKK